MAYILLIEDDADLREEISDFFVLRRHTVRGAGKLADARRLIAERDPDVVISDINLPDGDGAAFCAELAPRYPCTSWLVMSGDPQAAERGRRLRRGVDSPPFSVLNKPVSMRILDDFVRLAAETMSTSIAGAATIGPAIGDPE